MFILKNYNLEKTQNPQFQLYALLHKALTCEEFLKLATLQKK